MKKLLVVMVLLALIVPLSVSAQSADNEIFGMEFGFLGGYDLTAEDTVVGKDFALNFTLSDSMQLGFRAISGLFAADAQLLNFSYFLSPALSINMMVGSAGAGNPVGGVDAAFSLFSSDDDEAFSTGLKLKAGYIFDETNGVDGGVVIAGLVGSIGY